MNAVRNLRIVSFIEGLSTLVLFLIAMPIKYIGGIDSAVAWPGRIHGGLVIVFCIALWLAMRARRWQTPKAAKLFVASLIPFGFLWIDRQLKAQP